MSEKGINLWRNLHEERWICAQKFWKSNIFWIRRKKILTDSADSELLFGCSFWKSTLGVDIRRGVAPDGDKVTFILAGDP